MAYRTSIGLDVHARSVAAAAFIPETGEVIQKSFPYDPWAIAEWAKSQPQPARCVYESGPTGFDLQRRLAEAGVECCVGAVSKMLRPSGDRVKTASPRASAGAHRQVILRVLHRALGESPGRTCPR